MNGSTNLPTILPLYVPIALFGGAFEIKRERPLSEREFREFCANNPEMRVEQDKNGYLIVMLPVDFNGGVREMHAVGLIYAWWMQYKKGTAFSPTTGFKLPDGATRSADAAWASAEKVAALSRSERSTFAQLVPDFVIEVRSNSDRLGKLRRKMGDTWIKNGVRLAWLIDPIKENAYIHRADGTVETLEGLDHILSGEDVCPGLLFDLATMRV